MATHIRVRSGTGNAGALKGMRTHGFYPHSSRPWLFLAAAFAVLLGAAILPSLAMVVAGALFFLLALSLTIRGR